LQVLITVLENLAPLGLFRIGPSLNRLKGPLPVIGWYQSFDDSPTSAWCSIPGDSSFLALRLDLKPAVGAIHTLATLYRWQGVFVPIEVT
ncbi:hypothetical protein XENOCAPTIV_014495, partial [Xenoophorus captivus]